MAARYDNPMPCSQLYIPLSGTMGTFALVYTTDIDVLYYVQTVFLRTGCAEKTALSLQNTELCFLERETIALEQPLQETLPA
jgi:hypothetical protein